MKRIKVNTDSIGNARKVSENELQVLAKAVSDMNKSVEELNATWKGGNHDKFAKDYANRLRLIKKAQEQLDSYVKSIATVNERYGHCESDVAGLASF